jgi:hypothetical protein
LVLHEYQSILHLHHHIYDNYEHRNDYTADQLHPSPGVGVTTAAVELTVAVTVTAAAATCFPSMAPATEPAMMRMRRRPRRIHHCVVSAPTQTCLVRGRRRRGRVKEIVKGRGRERGKEKIK